MAKKFLDDDGLRYLWGRIKDIFATKGESIKSITRSGTTFTATRADNTTFTFTQQDNTVPKTTTTPKPNGTAAVGSETKYAAGDHVHPLQTTISGNAATATMLETARQIDGVKFDGSANIIHYGTCATAAATTTKVVECTDFYKVQGAWIAVKFTITNTGAVGSLKLNVNNTGEAAIKYRGGNLPDKATLSANRVYLFVYDGSNYELVGDLDTDSTYTAATANPLMDGSAAVGTSTKYAREDHVHPSDTSKVPTSRTINGQSLTTNIDIMASMIECTETSSGADNVDDALAELDGKLVLVGAQNTTGLVKNGSSVTSTTGLTACPIISGVPYYKDSDTTYTNEKLGQGYGVCTTASGTAAKTVNISNYQLVKGGIVTVLFNNKIVGNNNTLNINSKGAKPIFANGAAISDGIIVSGTTASFIYDGTNYNLISTMAYGMPLSIFEGPDTEYVSIDYVGNNGTVATAYVADYSDVTTKLSNKIDASQKGAANGVAPLDANAKIAAQYLPSYVDDVVEAYARSGQTALSSTWLATGSASGAVITPQSGVIYVLMEDSGDYLANSQFRWGGSAYVKLNDGGVSSITNEEIEEIVTDTTT